jgi:hypothetical protein
MQGELGAGRALLSNEHDRCVPVVERNAVLEDRRLSVELEFHMVEFLQLYPVLPTVYGLLVDAEQHDLLENRILIDGFLRADADPYQFRLRANMEIAQLAGTVLRQQRSQIAQLFCNPACSQLEHLDIVVVGQHYHLVVVYHVELLENPLNLNGVVDFSGVDPKLAQNT